MAAPFPLLYADNAVKALLGSAPLRVYPFSHAPQNAVVPYATYGVFSGQPQNQMDSVPSTDIKSTQIDVWAKTAVECKACADAIRDVLELSAHMTGFSEAQVDDETRLYRARMEFDFFEDR